MEEKALREEVADIGKHAAALLARMEALPANAMYTRSRLMRAVGYLGLAIAELITIETVG